MTHKGPRPVTWKDLDAAQRACLQTISTAYEKRRDADILAWSEARRARDLDVPERLVAERLEVSRATLQRQLSQRFPPPPKEQQSPESEKWIVRCTKCDYVSKVYTDKWDAGDDWTDHRKQCPGSIG